MSDEKMTNDELDTMIEDLDDVITHIETTKPVEDIPETAIEPENAAPARRETAYVNFDDMGSVAKLSTVSLESASDTMDRTMIIGESQKDVRVFDGSSSVDRENVDSTRVIDLDGVLNIDDEENVDDKHSYKKKKKYREVFGCLKSILYVVFVLVVAFLLAFYAYRAVVDVTGIGRDSSPIDIVVNEGDTTEIIAQKLKDQSVIQEPLFFRLYCRLVGADATFHPGTHTVRSNDGYDGIVDILQSTEARATVTITIPEGSTIDQIADLLEEKNVCTSTDFYDAITAGDFSDYDFIAELTDAEKKDRVYVLEGYLFPDTYEFLEECSAETAIRKMLDNFGVRVNADTRAAIKASGKTLSEVLIEASIIEKEAGFAEDMPRVMRVIQNRLDNAADFPRLEMDSTISYIETVNSVKGEAALDAAYNTYEREGLPVGAICNPGLAAINAALNPSSEPDIINCFYFASIVETGETQFFETYEEHIAWCREHGVGIYG